MAMSYPQEIKNTIINLYNEGLSGRKIAKQLGLSKSGVNCVIARYKAGENDPVIKKHSGAKILFIDIEVSPSVVLAFSRFKAFSTPDHVLKEPYILTACAKWAHLDGMMEYASEYGSDEFVVSELWNLLNEADVVVAHNAERFDVGWMNQQFVKYDIIPPSPYKVVDTLKILKKSFSLPSNSLDAACQFFGLERKKQHYGIDLWNRCMENRWEALDEMLEYNRQDVIILEQLFNKIQAYAKNMPNMALYYQDDGKLRCPHCGSEHFKMEKELAYTAMSAYNTIRCNDCGKVSRFNSAIKRTKLVKTIY